MNVCTSRRRTLREVEGLTSRHMQLPRQLVVGERAATKRVPSQGTRFALAKFRLPTLPGTLVARPVLHDRLMAGAGQRLTVVMGSAGAGKTVLLSSWAAARPPCTTSWLTCDEADANPVRFWAGLIEALGVVAPGFGADAAALLAMDSVTSADVTASIANDVAKLPAGSAIVVDDFHHAASAVSNDMTNLVERWPWETAQLVLASRVDPPLRLHRLRMADQLCELRDHDLYFSLAESHDLLANFGVQVAPADLALLHQRSEGWTAALQMAALSLRCNRDPVQAARALDLRSHAIAEYFVSEVLDLQPPEVARFMLDSSVLGELTADACAAVTGRQDSASMLRSIDAAHLFLVAQDPERSSFRYHNLVRQVLRGELQARDRVRQQALQLRAAEWFEAAGDSRRAARHFLAARQVDRALDLLHDRVVADFLCDPTLPPPLDLSRVEPSLLAGSPDRLLAPAADLLLSGDVARGGEYLDLLERAQLPIEPQSSLAARLAVAQALRYSLTGQADEAVHAALAARTIRERAQLTDEWTAVAQAVLVRAYGYLEDYEAVEREAAAALATPQLTAAVKLVEVPGAQAVAWLESGHLAKADDAATAAAEQARRLGFGEHFMAVDHLRTLAGLALERRDLDAAEQLIREALSISERRRPAFEFLALLDRAAICAARGQIRSALATVETARPVLADTGSPLLARADELEALLRLSLGDLRTPAELAIRLPDSLRAMLLARIALAAGDHHGALEHLQATPMGKLTPRRALVRQILLAAAAIERGDPLIAGILASALEAARRGGFCNTVVTTASQVTSYLIEHSHPMRQDPFTDQVVVAALEVHTAQVDECGPCRVIAGPLTAAEQRVLKLLPTSTYPQIAAALYISRSTVKTHLRSVYDKLGVASRSEAIERAVDLRLL